MRVVTDSASDILPSHAQAMGVAVVPSRIIMDGESFRDGVDITATQFYARLPRLRTPPHTEPAAPHEFYHTYQMAFYQGASVIISIHVSSHLSKLVQHARAARDSLAPNAIDVIDSQQAGIGMWPAVIRAAQLARMGAPAQVIHETTISILARTRMYALVESLEQLRRNGRIGRARELLGTMLDAHPIITIEQGEVTPSRNGASTRAGAAAAARTGARCRRHRDAARLWHQHRVDWADRNYSRRAVSWPDSKDLAWPGHRRQHRPLCRRRRGGATVNQPGGWRLKQFSQVRRTRALPWGEQAVA